MKADTGGSQAKKRISVCSSKGEGGKCQMCRKYMKKVTEQLHKLWRGCSSGCSTSCIKFMELQRNMWWALYVL